MLRSKRRRLIWHISALVFVVVASTSPVVIAESADNTTDNSFCETVGSRSASVKQRLNSNQANLQTAWKAQDERLVLMSKQHNVDRNKLYQRIDKVRSQNIAKLREQASSASQQQAIDQYQKSIEVAAKARREAVSTANKSFSEALKALILTRQTTLAGQSEAYRISLEDAFSRAEVECGEQVGGVTTKQNLLAAFKQASDAFNIQRQLPLTIGEQVKQIAAQRNNAVNEANENFKQLTYQAREQLSLALKAH